MIAWVVDGLCLGAVQQSMAEHLGQSWAGGAISPDEESGGVVDPLRELPRSQPYFVRCYGTRHNVDGWMKLSCVARQPRGCTCCSKGTWQWLCATLWACRTPRQVQAPVRYAGIHICVRILSSSRSRDIDNKKEAIATDTVVGDQCRWRELGRIDGGVYGVHGVHGLRMLQKRRIQPRGRRKKVAKFRSTFKESLPRSFRYRSET